MNSIEKQQPAVSHSLDAVSFFNRIVEEGYRLSLLESARIEKLQYEIIDLLSGLFHRYTSGQSSSVPVETGQRIQQSLFFTIGYYLKSFPDAETGLEILKESTLNTLYQNGKKLIEEDFRNAKTQLQFVQNNCLHTDILSYNDTIHGGLDLFFTSYDMDYGAHESNASIDYPLSNDKMNLTGIDYMCEYLKNLQLENEFCSNFHEEEIHSLLRGYDPHYKDLLFNIYELVLANAVGCLLLGSGDLSLRITDFDRQHLIRDLSGLSKDDLDSLIDQMLSELIKMLMIENTELKKHLKRSSVNLKARLKHALEIKELSHLFLSLKEDQSEPAIHFEDLTSMDHEEFRILADEIRECRFVADKIQLMQKKPLGMTDLIDLLEGDCFFGNEYLEVLQTLEDIHLALLTKKMPLNPVDSVFQTDESSKDWQYFLNDFLNQMKPSRKSSILKAADQIEFE